MTPLVLRAPYGLGDAIYVRPVIRDAARRHDVWIETPWPCLYDDLPVRFVRPPTTLRSQLAAIQKEPPRRWREPPAGARRVSLYYTADVLAAGSIYAAMARNLPPVESPAWDLPDFGPSPFVPSAPLVLVRPAVRRREWDNPSRNPRPEYISAIAADLKARGYAVVVVCDLSPAEEWIEGTMPPHNLALTHGELSTRQLLAAVRGAALLLGGVGWIVPAAIATETPAFIVLGGNGGGNAPDKLFDPRMKTGHIGFAWPESLCRCSNPTHACRKDIPDLMAQWHRWRGSATRPRAA